MAMRSGHRSNKAELQTWHSLPIFVVRKSKLRKKKLHTALTTLLLINLLFGQLGVSLLHDRHDYHEAVAHAEKGDSLQKHGEHCKVCSLDIVLNLLFVEHRLQRAVNQAVCFVSFSKTDDLVVFVSYSRGRAPPAVIA